VIESVKNVSEVHTPLSGEIIEINDKLTTNPVAINQDPYGEGWIFKLKLLDPEEGNKLIDFAAYNDIVKS